MKHPKILIALLICFINTAYSQQDFSKVQIQVIPVAGSVYMLTGEGGNIGVSVGSDGIIIVDDQFAPLVDKIETALKSITNQPVRFVINTHYHNDHTGGNVEFQKDASIIAHENVRKRMASGNSVNLAGTEIVTQPAAKEALPILTFDHKITLHLNGEDISALHYPAGHTDGDSIIYFKQSNVVHMGDDFITYGFPFIDQANGGSLSGMIDALENVLETLPADVKVIPGHGSLSSMNDVSNFLAMLKGTRAAVENAIHQGKTLEQMKSETILAPWSQFGNGFISADLFIDLIYGELNQ